MMIVQVKLHKALIVLGMQRDFSRLLGASKSPQEAAKKLEDFKGKAKRKYQDLMLTHHPDRGGDEEKAKVLTEAWNEIKDSKIIVHRPPPPPRVVTIIFNGYGMDDATTGSTGTSTSFYNFYSKI